MSTPARAIDADYLFAQTDICQRINELYPALNAAPIDEMARITEQQIASPRAFVAWAGEVIADDAGDGRRVLSRQKFTVLLLVRHAQQGDAGKRNAVAGPWLANLHTALAGYKPEGAHRPLRRVSGTAPNYPASVGIYPLTFELSISL